MVFVTCNYYHVQYYFVLLLLFNVAFSILVYFYMILVHLCYFVFYCYDIRPYFLHLLLFTLYLLL